MAAELLPECPVAPDPGLSEPDVARILTSLLVDELGRLRNRSLPPDTGDGWTAATRLDEDGIGFDSLALLDACGRVNQFFHLHEVGIEDYLFVRRTLGDWIEIVMTALGMKAERITFQTSGSTGTPKTCTHEMRTLQREIDAQAGLFATARRILSLVPCHHIYGFLFSVLLPGRLGVDVIDVRSQAPGTLRTMLRPGDLIVATPFQWNYLLTSLTSFPGGVTGVTSTAPMPADLRTALRQAGLKRLVEIYGSSETAGVGYRDEGQADFELFADWTWEETAHLLHRRSAADAGIAPPDRLVFSSGRRFRPAGRHDGAVQVGGHNVFPDAVATAIRSHADVLDCAVRLDRTGAAQRLKAFIVLSPEGLADAATRSGIEAWIRDHLRPAERPAAIAWGPALPRDALGKTTNW